MGTRQQHHAGKAGCSQLELSRPHDCQPFSRISLSARNTLDTLTSQLWLGSEVRKIPKAISQHGRDAAFSEDEEKELDELAKAFSLKLGCCFITWGFSPGHMKPFKGFIKHLTDKVEKHHQRFTVAQAGAVFEVRCASLSLGQNSGD